MIAHDDLESLTAKHQTSDHQVSLEEIFIKLTSE
jgi:hypothetical protein